MTRIVDYATLQQACLEWIGRDDDPNDDVKRNITTMIQVAENKLRPRMKGMRCLKTRAKALLDEQWEWLPDNLAAMGSVSILPADDEGQEYPLSYKGEEQFVAELQRAPMGYWDRVGFYTTIGLQLRFGPWFGTPTDGTNFRIIYYARPDALSTDAPTNVLLTDHPEIYLYATLVETAPYISDDNRVQLWRAALDDAIGMATENDDIRGTMAQSPAGWRP